MATPSRGELQRLLELHALALLRAVAQLVRRQPRRDGQRGGQLELVLYAQPKDDREAFERLARYPSGSPERALYRLVSNHGLSTSAEMLGIEQATQMMLKWIREGCVPPSWADKVKALAAPSGERVKADEAVRRTLPSLDGLSLRQAAKLLGVSHVTVKRWRSQGDRHVG